MEKIFGPVPSRRLGQSLGINNIPGKICTYNCVYCQIGHTLKLENKRRAFYKPYEIYKEVQTKITKYNTKNIDYITFVPDGEPTLDINLEEEITLLKNLKMPIAILTNGSTISNTNVKKALKMFDFISFKVDAVSESLWRVINRPHKQLKLNTILKGMVTFREHFKGTIATETMLISHINYDKEILNIATFLSALQPDIAYISIPTRPPAESWVRPPNEKIINYAFQVFSKHVNHVEYLINYEGNAFASSGDFAKDLLSITAVHPMRHEAVEKLLLKSHENWSAVEKLISAKKIMVVKYENEKFYMRRLKSRKSMKNLEVE